MSLQTLGTGRGWGTRLVRFRPYLRNATKDVVPLAQALTLALLLGAVFALFVPALQSPLRARFERSPRAVWALPLLLAAGFAAAARLAQAFSLPLILLVLAYLCAPVLCVWLGGPAAKRPGILDFTAILLLWLPLEFAAGAHLVPLRAQGFLHSVAYGIAILLGLALFLCFRAFEGMKYAPPRRARDWWLPVAGFAAVAPVLIVVGIAIGFIPPPHLSNRPAGSMAAAIGLIFAGTALPEEILFRALIQNLLILRFGDGWRTLFAAAVIFGARTSG